MSRTYSGRSLRDVAAERGVAFRNAAEAYRALTGETLSEAEASEALWYEGVRRRMVATRKRAGKSQSDVASAMGTSQSEISRLENGLGPGTQLGTLRRYLAAAGIALEDLLDRPIRPPSADAAAPRGEDPGPAMRVAIEGGEFTGVEAVGIIESLQALARVLRRSPLVAEQRRRLLLGVLAELARMQREGQVIPLRQVSVAVSPEPSEARFREAIAEPLDLGEV